RLVRRDNRMLRSMVACLSALSLVTACGGVPVAADESRAQRVCAGLPDALVDQGVADLRANVDGAAPLRDGVAKTPPKLIGASLRLVGDRGMPAKGIGRSVLCAPGRPAAPALAPAGARIEVSPTATGFTIAVRSNDYDLAREIERRASLFARATQ